MANLTEPDRSMESEAVGKEERVSTSDEKLKRMELKEGECDKLYSEFEDNSSEIFTEDPPPSYSVFVISHSQKKPAEFKARASIKKKVSCLDASVVASITLDDSTNCKACEDKTKPKSIGMETWQEFTKNTSLHGIKYVFDENPFTARRVVWLVCVLASLVLFGYQAIDRVCLYFRYPSYVNVQVVYASTIEFPSVTICNYNKYRLTEVVDRGLYQFIDEIYRSEYLSGRPLPSQDIIGNDPASQYGLQALNLTEFLLATAHQKNDLIHSCVWKGRNCDIETNFTAIFTDFGVCYTFNSDRTNRLDVNKSGSVSALSLTLNIEQYEYMSGPEHEAGLKALLHDPVELPQVDDLGFAIAPGTHTLVGIRRKSTDSLEAPYGSCVKVAPPRSYCLVQCLARQIEAECQCVDAFMDSAGNDTTICDMAKSFFCVRANLALATRDVSVDCQCPGPCHKVTYEPQLSYAQLSITNFDRILLSDPVQRSRLLFNFDRAREVSQRTNRDLVTMNVALTEALINATLLYRAEVDASRRVLTNDTYFLYRYGVSQELIDNLEMLSRDFNAINSSFVSKADACLLQQPDVADFADMVYRLSTDFFQEDSNTGSSSPLRQKLEECLEQENWPLGSKNGNIACVRTLKIGPQMASSSLDDYYGCDETNYTYLQVQKNNLVRAKDDADQAILKLEDMVDRYGRTMIFIFGDTSVNYLDRIEHQRCVESLQNASSVWRPRLEDFVQNQAAAYINTSCWDVKLSVLDVMQGFMDRAMGPESLVASPGCSTPSPQFDPCRWYLRNDRQEILSDRSYVLFQSYADTTIKASLDASALHQSITTQVNSLITDLEAMETVLLEPLHRFLNSSSGMTKMELKQAMFSSEVSMKEEARRLANQRYIEEWQQLVNKVIDVQSNVKDAIRNAFDLTIPALNTSLINSLELVQYVRKLQTFRVLPVATDAESPETAMVTIVETLYGDYLQAMQSAQAKITLAFNVLETASSDLCEELATYAKNGELDEQFIKDNFIKVDIFYKDLSYEKISLQVSFELMSLFSELGGLLGLLLGASILTLLELFDFILLLAVHNFRERRRNGEAK